MEEYVINNIENPVRNTVAAPTLAADLDEFKGELAELALTEDQEAEILGILWQMMGFFARTGFEVDVCGLIFQDFNEVAMHDSGDDMLAHSINEERPSHKREEDGAA